MQITLGRNRVLHALARTPLVPFVKQHEEAEGVVVLTVAAGALLYALAGILGAGVAMAAVTTGMIDLSNNNGAGAAVAISSPYLHAVEAKATEGLYFRDADYPIFRAAAKTHGKAFGGYFFIHPDESGKTQADYFLAYAHPKVGDLQPVVDSEIGSPCAAAPQTLAALNELVAKGYKPILYSNTSWLMQFAQCAPALEHFRVWEAEYGPVLNQVAGFHDIAWQFTDRANVAGHLVDGSTLMVRTVKQLEILPVHKLTPAQKAAKALTVRLAHLRTQTGYFAWYEWRHGISRWHGLTPAVDSRPNVPHRIRRRWWTRAAKQWRLAHAG